MKPITLIVFTCTVCKHQELAAPHTRILARARIWRHRQTKHRGLHWSPIGITERQMVISQRRIL